MEKKPISLYWDSLLLKAKEKEPLNPKLAGKTDDWLRTKLLDDETLHLLWKMLFHKTPKNLDWDTPMPKAKDAEQTLREMLAIGDKKSSRPPPENPVFAGYTDQWLLEQICGHKRFLEKMEAKLLNYGDKLKATIKLLEDEIQLRKFCGMVEKDKSNDEISNSSSCGDNTPNVVGGIDQNTHSTIKPYSESKRRKTRIADVLKVELVSIRGGLDKLITNLDQGNYQDHDDDNNLYDEIEKIDGMSEIVVMKVYQVLSADVGLARAFLSCRDTKRNLWLLVRFGRSFLQNEDINEAFDVNKYKSSN